MGLEGVTRPVGSVEDPEDTPVSFWDS